MSWDLLAADIPAAFRLTDDVPDDWRPPVIGSANQIIRRIMEVFPNAHYSDGLLQVDGEDHWIEIAITANDEDIDGFMMFVRGGESAAYAVAEILQALGLRAFDTGADDGAIFPGADVTAGWRAWRQFRDRVVDG